MLYVYLFFLILLLVGVTICFFRSQRDPWLPGNAKLLVDAWNLVENDKSQAGTVQHGKNDADDLSSANSRYN